MHGYSLPQVGSIGRGPIGLLSYVEYYRLGIRGAARLIGRYQVICTNTADVNGEILPASIPMSIKYSYSRVKVFLVWSK